MRQLSLSLLLSLFSATTLSATSFMDLDNTAKKRNLMLIPSEAGNPEALQKLRKHSVAYKEEKAALRLNGKIPPKVSKSEPLPEYVNLNDRAGPVLDQGDLGSCTANSALVAFRIHAIRNGVEAPVTGSRLYHYYNTRAEDGLPLDEDTGGTIAGSARAFSYGVISEDAVPYEIEQFSQQAHPKIYHKSIKGFPELGLTWTPVELNGDDIRKSLAAGKAVMLGMDVTSAFMKGGVSTDPLRRGIIANPTRSARSLGGHAILAIGYDNREKVLNAKGKTVPNPRKGMIIIRNSWGTQWGDEGNAYMSEQYLLNPKWADDFWKLSSTSDHAEAIKQHHMKMNKRGAKFSKKASTEQ